MHYIVNHQVHLNLFWLPSWLSTLLWMIYLYYLDLLTFIQICHISINFQAWEISLSDYYKFLLSFYMKLTFTSWYSKVGVLCVVCVCVRVWCGWGVNTKQLLWVRLCSTMSTTEHCTWFSRMFSSNLAQKTLNYLCTFRRLTITISFGVDVVEKFCSFICNIIPTDYVTLCCIHCKKK